MEGPTAEGAGLHLVQRARCSRELHKILQQEKDTLPALRKVWGRGYLLVSATCWMRSCGFSPPRAIGVIPIGAAPSKVGLQKLLQLVLLRARSGSKPTRGRTASKGAPPVADGALPSLPGKDDGSSIGVGAGTGGRLIGSQLAPPYFTPRESYL